MHTHIDTDTDTHRHTHTHTHTRTHTQTHTLTAHLVAPKVIMGDLGWASGTHSNDALCYANPPASTKPAPAHGDGSYAPWVATHRNAFKKVPPFLLPPPSLPCWPTLSLRSFLNHLALFYLTILLCPLASQTLHWSGGRARGCGLRASARLCIAL
jgi:hypothetical protein